MVRHKYFTCILFSLLTGGLFAQQGVHGPRTVTAANTIVNEYTALTADAPAGSTSLTVASSSLNANGRFASNLQPGDLVMIYEVVGGFFQNQFGVPQADTTWGKVISYNNCGHYELRQVLAVPNATTITLECATTLAFDAVNGQKSQVIRVPRYTTLTINSGGVLTCDDWNGTVGGVLAVEVQLNTVVNAGGIIDATGKGFRGGSLVGDNATSFGVNTTYSTNNALGAEKGEGIMGYQASYNAPTAWGGMYCRAPGANGGGGGDGHNAGGGGGANAPNSTSATAIWSGNGIPDQSVAGWGTCWSIEPPAGTMNLRTAANSAGGGRGGYSFSGNNVNATTVPPGNASWGGDARNHEATGLGGRPLDYSGGRIFLGGGGGAGDQNQSGGGIGGDGGGLIYMMCFGTVSGAGTITSNGANGANGQGGTGIITGIDAAGGAGAGGTVIVNAVAGCANTITITTNGGNGGNQVINLTGSTNEGEGPGGGGGGGYIAVSLGSPTRISNGGNNGTTNSAGVTEFIPNGATKGCPGTNNAAITNFDLSVTNQTVCATSSVSIPVVVSGTPPPGYVISWYAAALGGAPLATGTPYNPGVLAPGTYTYWVGTCPGWWREPVTITVVGAPVTTVSASANPICSGNSTTLTAGGANTYTWMPGSLSGTSVVVSPGITTTYTVTGTLTAGGCTDTETITITVNPTPTVTATASTLTICAGQSATLTGGGAGSYVWNPGALPGSPVTVSPVSTTTYVVTGTTAGCSNTASVVITVNPLPTVGVTASTNPICSGNSTTLTGSGANTYAWMPGSLSGTAVSVTPPTGNTTYTVTGTNTGTGCTNTAQLTVTVNPTPTTTATASTLTICNGQSTTLTGSGATTYAWQPGSLSGTSVIVSPTITQAYTVTGTTGTCSSSFVITVTVNPAPTIASVASINPICAGQSTNLSAGGASTYVWNPGALPGSPVTVSPGSTQTYTVTGTAANGCTGTSQLTVTVNPLPTVTSSASTNPICIGGSTNLTGGGATSYVWNPGAIPGSPITVTPPGTTTYTVTGTGANGCTNTSQLTVTVTPTPTVTAVAGTNPICNGSSVTLTASGATTYNWMPGSLSGTSVSVSPSITTAYTVTGTVGTCTSSFVLTVTVNPSPTITSSTPTNPVCAGTTVTLTAGGAVTYVWNPGSVGGNPINVTPASTTTYTVTGTDGNGCTAASQLTVTVNPTPTITASPASASICAGSTVTITASGGSTYNWMPGSLSGPAQNLSPASSTTYTITGTDVNGCIDTVQVSVVVVPLPVVLASSTAPAICLGGSVTLNASGAANYTWNPGALSGSSVTVSPVATTTYTVTGVNTGCSDTAQVTVVVNPLPVPTAVSNPPAICFGDTAALTAGGGTNYTWNGGTLVNASGANQTDNPSVSTTYSVVVTDANGCIDSTTLAVTVNTLPVADAGLDQTVCAGTTISINGNGGTTYTWNGGSLTNANGSSQSDTPPVQTDYELQVTDANGCTDLDTVRINVNALPVVSAGPDVQICINSTTVLNGTGASSYVWTPAASLDDDSIASPTASPVVTTTYVVVGTDGNGCIDNDTVVVTIGNNLTVFASNNVTICPGDTALITITGGTIWNWSPSATLDTPTNDSTNAFPTSTTTYTVDVQDANGCIGQDSVTVMINSSVALTASGTATICIGQSTSINASPSGGTAPYTYTWDNSLTGPGPQTVSPTTTTTYNVFVTDSIGCNSPTQSIVVTVNPPLSLNAITPASACVGNTATLTASGSGGDNNLTYTWYPGPLTGATQTVTVNSTVTYTVVLSDGCTTPTDTQFVTVTANQPPVVSLASSPSSGCGPLSTNFTGTSSGTCTSEFWDFGDLGTSTQNNPLHVYTVPGSYDVIYSCTDANGCVGTDTAFANVTVFANPNATFTASPSGTIQLNGGTAQVCMTDATSGATSWSWILTEPIGTQTSSQQNPCFTVTDTGVYIVQLTVTNAQGCTDVDTIMFNVDYPCSELYVPSAFSPNGDGTNDTFFVYGSCISFMQLEIYSRWGEQVFISTAPANGWDGKWRGKECESAIFTYVLRGQMDDGTQIEMQGNITLTR